MIVISRLRVDERTKANAAKKTAQGHSKLEIIRCLKRLLAREVYYLLQPATAQHTAPPDLTLAGFSIPSQPAARRRGQPAAEPRPCHSALTAPSPGRSSTTEEPSLNTQGGREPGRVYPINGVSGGFMISWPSSASGRRR
jgi:hypothetical protein